MLQSIKKTANGLVALFKDGSSKGLSQSEVGVWSPSLTLYLGQTGTPVAAHAHYVRTGNIVFCFLSVTGTSAAGTDARNGVTFSVPSHLPVANGNDAVVGGSVLAGLSGFFDTGVCLNGTSNTITGAYYNRKTTTSAVTVQMQAFYKTSAV